MGDHVVELTGDPRTFGRDRIACHFGAVALGPPPAAGDDHAEQDRNAGQRADPHETLHPARNPLGGVQYDRQRGGGRDEQNRSDRRPSLDANRGGVGGHGERHDELRAVVHERVDHRRPGDDEEYGKRRSATPYERDTRRHDQGGREFVEPGQATARQRTLCGDPDERDGQNRRGQAHVQQPGAHSPEPFPHPEPVHRRNVNAPDSQLRHPGGPFAARVGLPAAAFRSPHSAPRGGQVVGFEWQQFGNTPGGKHRTKWEALGPVAPFDQARQ